jgi:AcrR family transcriptional regulator
MAQSSAERRRAQIVRAAARLFERKGYHNTGMDDIAEAVGLRKPTLYHYVRSKAEIVVWIHNDVMNPLLQRLETNVARDIDPREGLRQVVADILEIMETKPGHLRVYFENHRELPGPLQAEAAHQRDRYEGLVESLIEEGVRRGVFRKTRTRLTTLALFGITNWSYQWYRPGGELGSAEVADHLLDLFLHGVAQPE